MKKTQLAVITLALPLLAGCATNSEAWAGFFRAPVWYPPAGQWQQQTVIVEQGNSGWVRGPDGAMWQR